MKIVVTGAGGFIGSHLSKRLMEAGHDVIGLFQPGEKNGIPGLKMVEADIIAGKVLGDAFAEAEAVIHLAARNHVLKETARNPLAEYRKVNVLGTANVIRAAGRAGIRRFVHFSSVKAMGEWARDILDEESPCIPGTPYGISKLESEEVVHNETNGTCMSSIVLRLPMVYGPGNKGNLPRMIRWAQRGYPFPIFHPENFRSMIYVGNVVAGIMAILKASLPASTTYILKDREDYSSRTVYSSICSALGKKPRYFPVPSLAVRLGGLLSEDFRKVTGSFRVSSAKFVRDTNFTPPFSLEEGITRTVEWYKRSVQSR